MERKIVIRINQTHKENIPHKVTQNILSDLLGEITSKKEWYSKVFNPKIVNKWKQEYLTAHLKYENNVIPKEDEYHAKYVLELAKNASQSPIDISSLFDMVINFARATAQGCKHFEDCEWDDAYTICDKCINDIATSIKKHPEDGYGDEDIKEMRDNRKAPYDEFECEHPQCECKPPDFELYKYVEYLPGGVKIKNNIATEFNNKINEMIKDQELADKVDWHPGSNKQVRDLIHPSLYCYVKGSSVFLDENEKYCTEPEGSEESRYQWLPSEFGVSKSGKVKVNSYINNLNNPEIEKYIVLYFESFLPHLAKVMKTSGFIKKDNLNNTDLQVIVKIGSIHLNSNSPTYDGGSWHIEGMPYEHICATCIQYISSEGITNSFLEFRKPVLLDEENLDYPQSGSVFTTHHYGITPGSHHEGNMNRYLGCIKAQTGASVIFPNTIQHRVKEFKLQTGYQSAERKILAFFVIDPNHRIISTKDVEPQYDFFTREKAEYYRERLMFHRKYFYSILNEQIFEREYSLCEH